MKVICRPRQMGKTYDLIKRCASEGGYIVCCAHKEVDKVYNMAKCMNLNIPFPITYTEFILGHYPPAGVKKFHIDNLDLCLQMYSKVPISTITLTSGERINE